MAEAPPVAHAVGNEGCMQRSKEQRPGKGETRVPVPEKQSSTSPIKACAASEYERPAQREDQHPPVAADADSGANAALSLRVVASTAEASEGGLPSMPTVFSRISGSLTSSRGQAAKTGKVKAKSPLDFPPRRLLDAVQHDPLSGDMHDAGVSPQTGST